MVDKFRMSQDELAYIYQNAQARIGYNPDIADEYKKKIDEYPFYESEDAALDAAQSINDREHRGCQIWAKIGKDDEYYYIQNYFIATDDNIIKQAAEYIGMAHIINIG